MTSEGQRQASVVPSIAFLMVVMVAMFFLNLGTDLQWWARVLISVALGLVVGAFGMLWTARRRR